MDIDYGSIGKKIKSSYPDAYQTMDDAALGQRYVMKYGVPEWGKPKPQSPFQNTQQSTPSPSGNTKPTPAPAAKTAYSSDQYAADLKRDIENTGGKNASYLKQYYDAVNAKSSTGGAGTYLNKGTTPQPTQQPVAQKTAVAQTQQKQQQVAPKAPVTGKAAPVAPQPQQKGFLQQAAEFLTGGAGQVAGQIGTALGYAQSGKTQEEIMNAKKMSRALIEKSKTTADPNEKKRLLALSREIDMGTTDTNTQFNEGFKQQLGTPISPIQGAIKTATGVGSIIAPVGTTVKGALAGGAVAGAAYAASQGNTPQESLKNAPMGAAVGATTAGVLKGAQLLAKGLADGLTKAGTEAGLSVLRPTKTQQANFVREQGQKLQDFIATNKLYEKGPDQVNKIIEPLQARYDDLAIKTGGTVKSNSLYSAFQSKINEIKQIPNAEAQRLAGQLENEFSLVKDKYGKSTIPVSEITKLRRDIDKFVPSGGFSQDPIVAGKNRVVRDIYKQTIDDATGGITKELGQQLKPLYAYKELAELQDGLGKGNLPYGIIQSLSSATGAGAGFAAGGIPGAITGVLLGLGLPAILNNPATIRLASEMLTDAGSKVAGTSLPPIVGRVAQVGAMRGVENVLSPQGGKMNNPSQGGNYQPEFPASQNGPDQIQPAIGDNGAQNNQVFQDTSIPGSVNTLYHDDQGNPLSYEDLANAQQQAFSEGNTDAGAQIQKMMDNQQAYEKSQGGTNKPLTATQTNQKNIADNGLRGLQVIKSELGYDDTTGSVDQGAVGKINLLGVDPTKMTNRKLYDAIFDAIGARLRIETGAAVSKDEIKRYIDDYFLRVGDDPSAINYQIQSLTQFLQSYSHASPAQPEVAPTSGQLPPIQ